MFDREISVMILTTVPKKKFHHTLLFIWCTHTRSLLHTLAHSLDRNICTTDMQRLIETLKNPPTLGGQNHLILVRPNAIQTRETGRPTAVFPLGAGLS